MAKILGLLYFFILCNFLYTSDSLALDKQRIIEAYKQHNQLFQLRCEVFDTSNTLRNVVPYGDLQFKIGEKLEQKFKLITKNEELLFNLLVLPDTKNKGASFELSFESGPDYFGKVAESFGRQYKKAIRLSSNNDFYQKYNLSTLTCYVEFAHARTIRLNDNIHISVHPHSNYDYRNVLTSKIEDLFNKYNSNVVLLEDGNFKENLVSLYSFLITGQISLPINDYGEIRAEETSDVMLSVSPAGHNRYSFDSNDPVTVDYSGGNHNYCIWNNSRNVMKALLESEFSPNLTINYLQDSIVLQCGRGIIRGLGISCRSLRPDNLLSRFLKSSQSKKYHQSYYQYFVNNTIPSYKHRYKKVIFRYSSSDFTKETQLIGSGERILKINVVFK